MFNFKQNNPHHKYDVWTHTLKAFENTPASELHRISVLFHDIGKPFVKTTDKKGTDHFKLHQQKSADLAKVILNRFCYPSSFTSDVLLLIKYHDERFKDIIINSVKGVTDEEFNRLVILTDKINDFVKRR